MTQREAMEFDVVIVGGGPSGLAAAIRLKQLAAENKREVSVCVLEKGSEVGAHILSGAVIDPIALNELIPDWQARGAPLDTPVSDDRFLILTADKSYRIPQWSLPRLMDNHGKYIASLGNV
jgi:electron-transferring-flavoprotein dehydrogenase